MFDSDDMYEIPDSDAKIYMTLDDIIKMEGIRKPGPGSVRSRGSKQSMRSNRSRRSTFSNRSRRSTFSNRSQHSTYSHMSKRSRKSNYSRRSSNNYYQRNMLKENNQFEEMERFQEHQFQKHPGLYTPGGINRRLPWAYYKNRVRHAVQTLTGFQRQRFNVGQRRFPNPKHRQKIMNWQHMNRVPPDITVQVQSPEMQLTRKSLALFNKYNLSRWSSTSRSTNYFRRFPRRHNIRRSLNNKYQEEISALQERARSSETSGGYDYSNMEFSPTPHTTSIATHDRFSSLE
ncbi:uncharacterized protein LOC142322905 [Lycorma delicatula]|uniref:uncharacterized protein LOC142322905 n=1 Tax=Lycorma delicatula TaxID=130591 RepID=UPI003F5182AF